MRIDLQTHPKVVRILSATKADKFRAIGGLHAVWSVFDTHSVDGALHGYTPETLDHIIGWEGFASAMITVGWMCFDGDETLTLPEFGEHNGQSAKRRAEDQKRKKNDRKNPESVRKMSANNADKMRTREEKRREDTNNTDTSVSVADKNNLVEPCPHQSIIDLYHQILPMGLQVRVWNGTRASHLKARWREDEKRQSLEYWERLFNYVAESPFLTGKVHDAKRHPFEITLEWIVSPNNFAKIIEGFYHRGAHAA